MLKLFNENINSNYIELLINSPFVKKQSEENTQGVGNKNLVIRCIKNFIIPLPPLEEQKRIVAKVDSLFKLIEELDNNKQDFLKNISDSRNKVLQLAIQGKLVSQDENDKPASVLLEIIRREREQLIKDKKIKKDKLMTEINEEEIPFEIPKSWEWIRLVELSKNCEVPFADGPFGSNLKSIHYTDKQEVRIIQLSNIGENGWKDSNVRYTTFEHSETIKRSMVEYGNLVIAKMMPAGRTIEVPDIEKAYVLSSDAVKFVPHPKLDKKYLLYAINSDVFRKQINAEVQGTTRVRTSLTKIKGYLIPLPPVEEQKRIVAKLDIVMNYLDTLEKQLN